jgi:hypothetical protein
MNQAAEIKEGISYQAYRDMIDALMSDGKTTGTNHSANYLNYTEMNVHRMSRHDKRVVIADDLKSAVQNLKGSYTWLVLTEAWCGDAAHSLPVMAKMAKLNPNVDLRLLLRDEHLELMDEHLTNGGRSIPKLVIIDNETNETVAEWGPRPAPVQQIMLDYKSDTGPDKLPYDEFNKKVQLWYSRDKNATTQAEFTALLTENL